MVNRLLVRVTYIYSIKDITNCNRIKQIDLTEQIIAQSNQLSYFVFLN